MMAGTIIEVNTSTLRNDISSIETEISSLKKDVERLRNSLSQLSTMWDGKAKVSFVASVNDDIGRLSELIDAINKFTDKTDSVRADYEKCEIAVANMVASIKV